MFLFVCRIIHSLSVGAAARAAARTAVVMAKEATERTPARAAVVAVEEPAPARAATRAAMMAEESTEGAPARATVVAVDEPAPARAAARATVVAGQRRPRPEGQGQSAQSGDIEKGPTNRLHGNSSRVANGIQFEKPTRS